MGGKTKEIGTSELLAQVVSRLDQLEKIVGAERKGADGKPSRKELVEDVTELLRQIGVSASLCGYGYLREAILMAIEEPDVMNSVTKTIYPGVAQKYNSNPSKVERGIRHSIELAWRRGNATVLDSIFGYTVDGQKGKTTNSEFIAMVADRVRVKRGIV